MFCMWELVDINLFRPEMSPLDEFNRLGLAREKLSAVTRSKI